MEYELYELQHHGVKGMKWGVRKKTDTRSDLRKRYDSARAKDRAAAGEYSKSFNKAYDRAIDAYSPFKSRRAANNARWLDVGDKAKALSEARDEYKTVKAERKQAIKDTTAQLRKDTTLAKKLIYNDAVRKRAAKYVVDNNMSVAEATKKAESNAWRNSAILVAGYGAIAVATLYANR